MAGLIGNDPADMQDLMSKLAAAVEQIHTITSTLDNKAQSVQWKGADADRFKSSDWPSYSKQLKNVATNLDTVKQTVSKQKAQQEAASA